jgi:hypothetical protein
MEELFAGQRHAAAVVAVRIGRSSTLVPFSQQPNFKFRFTKKLVPSQHWQVFAPGAQIPADSRRHPAPD